MGCLLGARMAHAGIQTTLVDYRSKRASLLKASGVTVESSSGSFTETVNVVSSVPTNQDLIIVCVRSYQNESLSLPDGAPVLTLQTGLNNAETLCDRVGGVHVLAGVTTEAAQTISDGRVKHLKSGVTRLGAWTSCPTSSALEALTRAGFEVLESDSPGQSIWENVAIKSATEPLTVLLNVITSRLPEIAEVRQLMRDLVVEAVKVAATEGYRFSTSLVDETDRICRESGEFDSLALRDIRSHKRTEIDAISGEIIRRGQLGALPTPRTRVMYQLIKGLERR